MPTTPILALPYPASTAAPNVPADMQALAQSVETAILKTQAGSSVVTLNASGDATIVTGLTTVTGFVTTNGDGTANAGIGVIFQVQSRSGGSITVRAKRVDTGATLVSVNARVDWIAYGA